MSTTSKKRKNSYKILFFILLLGFVAVSAILFTTNQYNTSDLADIQEIKKQLEEIKTDNQTLQAILAADDLLISQTNPNNALKQYESVYQDASAPLQSIISSRIEYTKQLIEGQEDDEATKINLRSQIAKQQEVIDSVSKFADSLRTNTLAENEIKSSQIDSLKGVITQQNNELKRKDAKQIISFTNENGNLIHYLGEVKNGKANGGGIGIWNTGSIYKGQWKENLRHGKGEFTWADGQKYKGEFEDDIRSGEGIYYWPSGEKYEGEFADNRMNGEGILYDPDGNKKYEGLWKNDKPKQ